MIQHQHARLLPVSLRHRLMAATLAVTVAGGIVLGLPAISTAQNDGTGAATPTPPSTCLIVPANAEVMVPELVQPSGTPGATPVASPIASLVVTIATPVASPIASPVVDPVTDAANADVLAELVSTTESMFGCLNERNFADYAQVTSDTWRGNMFGSDQSLGAEQFVNLAAALPESDTRLIEISALQVTDPTTVTAEVTYVSAYQQRAGIWTFVKQDVDGVTTWALDRETPIAVEAPLGAYVIDLTFEDNGYTLDPDKAEGSDVVLNLSNPTAEDHEALVLRFADGVSTDAVLQSTSAGLPEGVTLIGQSTVLAGGKGTMLLTDLQPGTYTIVDLLPAENGLPNLSNGMSATFTVED